MWILLRLHFSSLGLLMKCWMLITPGNTCSFKICLISQCKQKKSGIVSKCLFFFQIKAWAFNFSKSYRLERECVIECLDLREQVLHPHSGNSKHCFHFNSAGWKSLNTVETIALTTGVHILLWPLPEHSESIKFDFIFPYYYLVTWSAVCLPREMVESVFLEVFTKRANVTLRNMV